PTRQTILTLYRPGARSARRSDLPPSCAGQLLSMEDLSMLQRLWRALSQRGHIARRRPVRRLELESLEDRTVPSATGWVIDAASPVGTNRGLALDGQGNSYITGSFSGTTNLGGVQKTSAGGGDGYVAKYAADGSVVWARSLGGAGDDETTRVAADAIGNVYVAG